MPPVPPACVVAMEVQVLCIGLSEASAALQAWVRKDRCFTLKPADRSRGGQKKSPAPCFCAVDCTDCEANDKEFLILGRHMSTLC